MNKDKNYLRDLIITLTFLKAWECYSAIDKLIEQFLSFDHSKEPESDNILIMVTILRVCFKNKYELNKYNKLLNICKTYCKDGAEIIMQGLI